MKFVPCSRGAYEVSTCGRFVWSQASDKFLKVDRGYVTLSIDGQGRRRWATKDLLECAQRPTTTWINKAKLFAHVAFFIALIAVASAHLWLDSVEHLVARYPDKRARCLWDQLVSATAELNSSIYKVVRTNHT